jgi:hypothetical protein
MVATRVNSPGVRERATALLLRDWADEVLG